MMPDRMKYGPTTAVSASAVIQTRQDAIRHIFRGGFSYSRKLLAHNSCVNTLAFSSGAGRWLASAGDDPFIYLWDFHSDDVLRPARAYTGPRANVFALTFSAHNQYLYSGDTNNVILQYDISRLDAMNIGTREPAVATFQQHTDSVRAISCHPEQDDVFLSASEDGTIVLQDSRARRTRAQGTLQQTCEFTGVQYHPRVENLFATSDNRGQVCLRDTRMAFGPLSKRSHAGIVQIYTTTLSKQTHFSKPEASSITFDREGGRLAVTMLHYLPVIYSLGDPLPIATCSGRYLPDGTLNLSDQRSYSNACTIKHGCFGGPGLYGDEYFSSGSDDFRAYVWKLPDTATLTAKRTQVDTGDPTPTIGFTSGRLQPRYVPVELSTPLFRLNGHNSIVNTTLIHPHLLHIVTSGIERRIILHSPTASSPCTSELIRTSSAVRALPEANPEDHARLRRALDMEESEYYEDDDRNTTALFDEILRQEGEADVFEMRRWLSSPSDELEEDEMEVDDMDAG